MNNLILLLTLNDSSINILNDLIVEIKEYFTNKGFVEDINTTEEFIVMEKNSNNILIEYKKLNDENKYLFNIYYADPFSKNDLLKELFFSEVIISTQVIFDTGSNKLLKTYHCNITDLENIVKYYSCSRIASIQGNKVFDIINNLKVKDDIGENYTKMITSLQRIELKNLFDYMSSNPLGGDELNILRGLSKISDEDDCDDDKIDKIRNLIENNIFKKLNDIVNRFGIRSNMFEWRNIISHNCCIENNIFEEIGKKIIDLNKELIDLCAKIDSADFLDTAIDRIPEIAVIVSSKNDKSSIILRIIEILNNIYDNRILVDFINKDNIEIQTDMFSFKNEFVKIYIKDIEAEIKNDDNDEFNTYKIIIFLDKMLKCNDINYQIYKLLDEISEKYIVINDSISGKLCDYLYSNINLVENLVRLYIKISQAVLIKTKDKKVDQTKNYKSKLKMNLDLSALRIKIDDNKIDLINNELYDYDFISLLDKLSDPLTDPKYSDLIEKEKYKDIEEFNNSIADLSAIDENIASIKDKWKELYRIRTMVAHNYIINYSNYIEYNKLYKEALNEIEVAVFNLLQNNISNYNINCTISNQVDTSLTIRNIYSKCNFANNIEAKYQLEFKQKEKEVSYYIPLQSIWLVINKIFELNMNDDVIIFTYQLIEKMSNINWQDITDNKIEEKLKKIINLYKYDINAKSKNFRRLEGWISELLEEVANEYNAK